MATAGLLGVGAGCSDRPSAAGAPTTGTGGAVAGNGSGGTGAAPLGSGGQDQLTGGTGGGLGTGGSGGSDPGGSYQVPTVEWPSAECVNQIATLMAGMSNLDKARQMVMGRDNEVEPSHVQQGLLGTVFAGGNTVPAGGPSPANWAASNDALISAAAAHPLGIPIFYGVDAVHGHSKSTGTVIFPHNIGLGATRNPALVEEIGRITAFEMAATGATYTYGPMLSVSHDDRWGRAFESYSEDPDDVALLGGAMVAGLQGRGGLGTGAPGVVACAKHFAGDGQGTWGVRGHAGGSFNNGVDRSDVQISEEAMRQFGIAPYLPAIQAGLGSVMVSDTTWNGQNMTASRRLVTEILKDELGFQGFVATDWEVLNIAGVELVETINAGVDLIMDPGTTGPGWDTRPDDIVSAVNGGAISQERFDDAVRRILTVKCEAGLFGWTRDPELLSQVGSDTHRAVARQAVRESLVLLQHEGSVLPLPEGTNVWVAGSGATGQRSDLVRQAGGWTVHWQGIDYGEWLPPDTPKALPGMIGDTIYEAIGRRASIVADLASANYAVVVLSEEPYAEFVGDRSTLDQISKEDFALLAEARAAGVPVVAILMTGRPVLIESELANADAWIAAWLPGTEGGGVADVLFGEAPFTGKLSHSWPRTDDQTDQNKDDPGFDPLFPYGHGLTL